MRDNEKILVLTGGLGNQLFQLAAGLTIASPENLEIDCNLGRPRLNQKERPDLDSFLFPSPLCFNARSKKRNGISSLGLLGFKISSKKFDGIIAQRIWLSIKDKASLFKIFLSDGVGFDPRLDTAIRSKWIFGPFHTFRYVQHDSIRRFMLAMTPREYPDWLNTLKTIAPVEKPIVLHVRLSDYRNIPELGILSGEYFNRSLCLAIKEFPNSRIWLFTDEEDLALEIVDEDYLPKMRIINYDLTDSASNLEAMRFGHCYIMSNSTFSWWGAYLSHSPKPMIFCPANWFRTKRNPLHMIPIEWEMVANK